MSAFQIFAVTFAAAFLLVVLAAFAYALCRIAGEADDAADRMAQAMKEGQK